MISAKLYTNAGAENGTAELPDQLFGEKVNDHVMWLSVKSFLAAQRQGTHSVRNRKRIRGGGRKPFRQKGTGMARQGTRRSPLMVGGARAFGPRPRDYDIKLPRKVKALGLRSAMSLVASEDRVCVVADFNLDEVKTRKVAEVIKAMGLSDTKCLVVLDNGDRDTWRAARNIRNLNVTNVGELNTYAVLNCEKVVITESALSRLKGGNEG